MRLRPLGPWHLSTFTEYVYEGSRIVAHIPRKQWRRNYEAFPGDNFFGEFRWGPVMLDEEKLPWR